MKKVLTFILAGGRGERLDPLTRDRTKPAVPFGGIYRIIDFTLSNCINSGLRQIYLLTQYKSFSLQKHVLSGWGVVSTQLGEFIDIIPAQQRISDDWYRGTADALYQNLYAIEDQKADIILILAGDHVYKMDYAQLIQDHIDQKADMTVACSVVPKEESDQFGVIEVNKKNFVLGFQEKPSDPKVLPRQKESILASMGIYVFNKSVLTKELEYDAADVNSNHDFGKNIIPRMIANKKKVYAHAFCDANKKSSYWRDIGTRDAYYQANMDLVSNKPLFNIYDKEWPLRTYYEPYPPSKIVGEDRTIVDSIISGGCIIESSFVKRCVLSPNVIICSQAQVENSVLMEGVVIGKKAKIKNAIIDKKVTIPEGMEIGYDHKADKERFTLTKSGIVIVAKKAL
ncbi:MAG: glucose-1-phosphate adenylyltransferase [Candidatus Omnitrophota bacterium]|jgi:glucose-1-phosphate adenylyltransferase